MTIELDNTSQRYLAGYEAFERSAQRISSELIPPGPEREAWLRGWDDAAGMSANVSPSHEGHDRSDRFGDYGLGAVTVTDAQGRVIKS